MYINIIFLASICGHFKADYLHRQMKHSRYLVASEEHHHCLVVDSTCDHPAIDVDGVDANVLGWKQIHNGEVCAIGRHVELIALVAVFGWVRVPMKQHPILLQMIRILAIGKMSLSSL